MIPKIIWQTYKNNFKDLPDYALSAAETWINKNPEWQYNYMSDDDVMDFVRENFGHRWEKIFNSCPVGVMKADIWRIMVLYINGGMYTDLDTTCNVPIDSWLDKISDKKIILNAEHEIHIQQWTFLSEKNHPILSYMLDNIDKAFDSPDYSNPHFVHAMTGPGIFTKSILDYLGIWEDSDDADGNIYMRDGYAKSHLHKVNFIRDVNEINNLPKSTENGLFIVPSHRFFHNEASTHLYGSQSWNDGKYTQWIFERDEYANKKNN
jgi:alpha 1,6-mannosyltransferase